MGKTLVIAEKPSVALDIARALGKFEKQGDYFENEHYVISSAIGHLVELCLPGELDKQRGKWSFQNLPIIPDEFQLKPIEKTEGRFKLLKRLMKRDEIDLVINACDAGREGELIFRYLVKLADTKKRAGIENLLHEVTDARAMPSVWRSTSRLLPACMLPRPKWTGWS